MDKNNENLEEIKYTLSDEFMETKSYLANINEDANRL